MSRAEAEYRALLQRALDLWTYTPVYDMDDGASSRVGNTLEVLDEYGRVIATRENAVKSACH